MKEKSTIKGFIIGVLAVLAVGFTADSISNMDLFMKRQFITDTQDAYSAYQMQPYEIDSDTTADTVYIRYKSGTGKVFIKKIDESGSTVVISKARDLWSNRASATYIPYNETE